ncbi:TrbG/VirB9 family P-type conjugative transfer protein [uncultured Phenylobacterium sp.]|uniref:TrbG/VirB9 family P-type conjugative transfer protein n=1 Tax=uncultured Phenylobacterium sp. TaxID=349273 RepID=UPI0025F8DCB6|nr:TrbG/VirB9 family P-type conjugative transfer protein [uncultured Phenylobacterium sp.]
MDPRRLLILCIIAGGLGGCSYLSRLGLSPAPPAAVRSLAAAPDSSAPVARSVHGAEAPPAAAADQASGDPPAGPESGPRTFVAMAPIPNPGRRTSVARARPAPAVSSEAGPARDAAPSGRAAIAAANSSARQTSRARAFLGGVQVFVYDPGRVYEVWTAPLRVTTLTLSRGETVISKAAGDTVRWQIGETQSGEGPDQRAHVMIKPLARGLETNLVLPTNRRVYLVQLRSGDAEAFNAAVTWDLGAVLDAAAPAADRPPPAPALVAPQGPLDAGFRIRPKGRRPAWTPTAVATDGIRTFLTFPPGMAVAEAPALFALGPSGDAQLVNYRQQGALWVVDRVLTAAELRMGGRHAQVVRIERIGAAS